MIDLHLLRQDPETIKKKIIKKEPTFDVDALITLDEQVRQLTIDVEALRNKRNELSKKGAFEGVTDTLKQQSIELGKQLKAKEKELETLTKQFKTLALSCPNTPQDDVPTGNKKQNKVVQTVGKKPSFAFTPKNHLELNEQNDWFDLQTAAAMSGANFVVYKSAGVKILYALTHLMLKNNIKYGFEPVLPPYLVNEQALINSGNLPKFQGDFYTITEDGLCLTPTAEVNLTNMHVNQIFDEKNLPKRYTAWTSCFRREAGGYGTDERGLIRIHQFEKVEIYSLCHPSHSTDEHERMLACSQDLLQQLDLHYRVSLLAAQDCSFSSAKTYDIEIWLPGQQNFYELSSCSNCTDFQARRAKIRYRAQADSKPALVHTLNGSSLALPRLMIALMEQGQQEDGTIKLPPILEQAVAKMW